MSSDDLTPTKAVIVTQMDRGLAYAESCFETFRVINGQIFCWPQHWQRLTLGLASFGIKVTDKDGKIWKQSCLQAAKDVSNDCLLRLTVSGGDAAWGLFKQGKTQFFIQVMPFVPHTEPFHAVSVVFPFTLNSKVAKFSADYAQTLRAIQIWQLSSKVQPAVCKDGHIIGGLTANILLLSQDKWLSPAMTGVLPGIVREFLHQKKEVTLASCPVALLETCEAIVFCNSGQFLRVAASINGRALATSHPAIRRIKKVLAQEKGVQL